MNHLTIGALCAGYGGLDLAVQSVFGGYMAWHSEIAPGAMKVLAHRFPDATSIGDMTTVDWSTVPPVDILTGGTPCQDLSHAGKRAGMTEGTRSNLWVAMREAIAALRPSLVVWENVSGALSAEADSDLGRDPGLLAGVRQRPGRPVLRAAGRVVGDLSSLGYVGGWHALRAADVHYAHGRLRIFVVAWPADADPSSLGPREGRAEPAGLLGGPHAALGGLLPTPTTAPDTGNGHARDLTSEVRALLPTPAVNDMGAAYTPETWDAWTARMKAEHDNGNGHGKSLNVEVQRLLPTPNAIDAGGGPKRLNECGRTEADHGAALRDVAAADRWGDYADAIARHANTLGRPAPAPTETGPRGNPRLSCRFDEWLMGLPDGWITDVPDITHRETLRLCGNGVVPGQAAAGIRHVLATARAEAVA